MAKVALPSEAQNISKTSFAPFSFLTRNPLRNAARRPSSIAVKSSTNRFSCVRNRIACLGVNLSQPRSNAVVVSKVGKGDGYEGGELSGASSREARNSSLLL